MRQYVALRLFMACKFVIRASSRAQLIYCLILNRDDYVDNFTANPDRMGQEPEMLVLYM